MIAIYSRTILILLLVSLFSSAAFAAGKPSELILVMPNELAMPADKIPTKNLLDFLGIPPFDKLDSNKTWYHANGKQANIGSTWYHANGKQANIGSTWYHANGKQANIGSTWYHANGKQA
ncbi:hypothetical protein, partial [Amphritea atlantica]|uniref:hypothetical protein n=1 Tax=Amphritea atlantica TaxID=355243 RepID=UPI001C06C9DC